MEPTYGEELLERPTIVTTHDTFSYKKKGIGKAYLKINRERERVWVTDSGFVVVETGVYIPGGGMDWQLSARYPIGLYQRKLAEFFRSTSRGRPSHNTLESPFADNRHPSLSRRR